MKKVQVKYGKYFGEVKTEFGKFGDVLDKTKRKLQEISNTVSDASVRSRAIQRKLKDVEALPIGEDVELLDEALEEDESENIENE